MIRESKAILISKLERSVKKHKAKLLESSVKMRSFGDSNVKLTHDLCCPKRSIKTWMFISAISVVVLLSVLARMAA